MRLNPQETFDAVKEEVIKATKETFPIEEGNRILEVEKTWVEDSKDINDLRSQKRSRMQNGTWAVPLKAKLVLKDKNSGRVINRKTVQLARIPKTTRRFSYIVDGNEYGVMNQWLLKPGVYNRVRKDGTIASEFHTKGKSFRVEFDPEDKKFYMKIGGARPELYPLLKDMGVDDSLLKKQWGEEILAANKKTSRRKSTERIYKAYTGELPTSKDEAVEYLHKRFQDTELDEDTTKLTLSKPYKTISLEAILDSTKQTIGISRGERKPDTRDSLVFKKFNAVEDHLANKIRKSKRDIHNKVKWNFRRFDDIERLVPSSAFEKPMKDLFSSSSLSVQGDQVNPIEFLSDHLKTTVLGEGGLSSEQQSTDEMKHIDPSHFGFLDPLATPESSRTGLTLHLAEGVEKQGDTLSTPVWNVKKNRLEHKTIQELHDKTIIMPDQVEVVDGGIKYKKKKVKAFSPKTGPLDDLISPKEADYSFIVPQQAFTAVTNLLPFVNDNSPIRATTAGRQLTQAVPLKHREEPLVQAAGFGSTVEKNWGTPNSHVAPVEGTVTSVQRDGIKIKDKQGKTHEVQLYHNFPLNADKSFLDSEVKVSPGQKVKKGQLLADTIATKNGTLSLGSNLKVAYLPMKGLTYEDAAAISETGAKKMTSLHLHKKSYTVGPDDKLNKNNYKAYYGDLLDKKQSDKLDDDGVIKKGLRVDPGDTLIAALKNKPPTTETRMLQKLKKSLVKPYSNGAVTWDKNYPGYVTDVSKRGKNVKVFVRTEQPIVEGDKIVGRAGNKGIIAKVIPDAEMPKDKDGNPVELLMNSQSVPGRINMSQVFETAASKIAEKKGKPYLASSFSGKDVISSIKKELKENGLSDKEPVFDASTGKKLGDALIGKQYMLKLKHSVENKSSARGGPGKPYDRNRTPKSGGPEGAQSLGNLGIYGMLARGNDSKANLREMQTWKVDAEQADEVWKAIQMGTALPPPRTTFANQKLMNYIKGMGVDIKKEGNSLVLAPMTDKQIKSMSAGEIKDPGKMVKALDPSVPEKDGLFDQDITGGMDGKNWAHLKLPEVMPNPMFEKGIRSLLGMTESSYMSIVNGKKGLDKEGNVVPVEKASYTSGKAIKKMLDSININKELNAAKAELKTARKDNLNKIHNKVKYLKALKKNKMSPSEAYMTNYIPILPPTFRPLAVADDGSIVRDDLNELYKSVGMVSQQLKDMGKKLPEKEKENLRTDLYDGMKALTGIGVQPKLQFRGLIDIISGKRPDGSKKVGSPKEGFFQDKLIGARQNLTMRSTITPDPKLGLDEVGLPRQAAMEIYKPFVVREITSATDYTPLQAQELIKQNDPTAQRALESAVQKRPVWLKRDPVLHKYGVQAFKPKLVDGKIIRIHPLVTSGFNADFDGDTMAAFVPISHQAVQEAYKAMPSRNLFNFASGKLMYLPSKEMQTGLFLMTRKGKKKNKAFSSLAEAEKAVSEGKLDVTDIVKIEGRSTTTGRMRVAKALPKPVAQEYLKKGKALDKKEQNRLFTEVAKKYKDQYGDVANKLKDWGNDYMYNSAFSLGLDDFTPHKDIRDSYIKAAEKMISKLPKSKQTPENKMALYDKATERMLAAVDKKYGDKDDKLFLLQKSGAKPGPIQYRQIALAPMLVQDGAGGIIPSPVKTSFSEGLDMADYWKMSGGARQGTMQAVQSVRDPGYLSKQLINTTMDQLVTEDDCGTTSGVALDCTEDGVCYDRVLAKSVKIGSKTIPAGTVITPDIASRLQSNGASKVVVRSPLKCKSKSGVCSKCIGVDKEGHMPEVGTNIGVISGQALGERSTQLALRAFHGGGVLEAGGTKGSKAITDNFTRVQQLLTFPKKLPGAAPIAKHDSVVRDVKKDPAGGYSVDLETKLGGNTSIVKQYIPQELGEPLVVSGGKAKPLKKGTRVPRGSALAKGPINPHDLLEATNIDTVQNYLTDEMYNLYKKEGVDRRHVELNVKAATDSAIVDDPGDVPGYDRGDYVRLSTVRALNKETSGNKMRVTPKLRGVNLLPVETTEDWMARMNYNRISDTLVEAAQQGWAANTSGEHPIPALIEGKDFGLGKFY